MKDDVTSKADILRRIRAANGGASDGQAARSGWDALARNYNRKGSRGPEARLDLLEDRLRDYDATVLRSTRQNLVFDIARRLKERGSQRIVIPTGFASEWLPKGFHFVVDGDLTIAELDACDGVLTESTTAIAETGTVVLQNVAGQGRRAVCLVPDYHLCIVRVKDVLETVPEAMSFLGAMATLPTTFISGPSATADIEMTRIKGVHGPRILDVILCY